MSIFNEVRIRLVLVHLCLMEALSVIKIFCYICFLFFSTSRYQWVEEIRKHLVNVDQGSIFVVTNGKDVIEDYVKVVITSYDLMTTLKGQLSARKFGVIIMVCTLLLEAASVCSSFVF